MKELSIEDKAKRYDEALARANEMIKAMTNIGGVAKVDDIQHLFPELKESEDERIRKEIIDYIKHIESQTISIEQYDSWIAWLEKQKGIKEYGYNAILEVNGIVRDINFIDFDTTGTSMQIPLKNHTLKSGDKVKVTINKFEKQGEKGINGKNREIPFSEQKPAWGSYNLKGIGQIDKDVIITEIERLRKNNEPKEDKDYAQFELDVSCGYNMALDDVEKFLDTLEVKEVDDEPGCKIFPRPIECYSNCKECPFLATSNKAQKGE